MNSLVFLPLLVAACVAAPKEGYYAEAKHEVTAHVPAGVELQAVSQAVAVAPAVVPAVVPAVPGYKVDGEVHHVTKTLPEPPAVAVDVNTLPVLGAPATYAAPYTVAHAPVQYAVPHKPLHYAVPHAPVPYAVPQAHLPYAVPHTPVSVAPAPIAYSNVNLNVPAPVPEGEAPAPEELVQEIPVKALGRPIVSYTPQVTEVHPELKIYEKKYNVPVPKPVYQTKHVTPVHHKYVAKPYAVPHHYPVPQPYAVPHPVHVPYAVAPHHYAAVPAVHGYAAEAEH